MQHIVGYGGLGALPLRATAGGRLAGVTARAAAAAWAIATVYGLSDEYHQCSCRSASPDAADVAADALGAGAAVVRRVGVRYNRVVRAGRAGGSSEAR